MLYRRIRQFFALALLVGFAFAAPARAELPDSFTSWYGLPGLNAPQAQWVRAFAYSTPPTTVYAGLEDGGVFKSDNFGLTWQAANGGFPNPLITDARALLASSTGTTVYAGTDTGVWKTTGGNWEPLAQGTEEDPAHPKKLNESVQSLFSEAQPGGAMLAGVFSGGVFKSTDSAATWTPPKPNNGIPSWETVTGITSNIPPLIYATGGSGVYVSVNGGDTWTRKSDGIPGGASPITTWAATAPPDTTILYTSTGSNGIYRSLNAGLSWAPINDGLGAVRARGFVTTNTASGTILYAATEEGLWMARSRYADLPDAPRWHKVTEDGLHTVNPVSHNVIMWALTKPVIPAVGGAFGLMAGTQSNGGYFIAFHPPSTICPTDVVPADSTDEKNACPKVNDTTPKPGQVLTVSSNGAWQGTPDFEYEYQWEKCTSTDPGTCTPIAGETTDEYVVRELDYDPDGDSNNGFQSLRFRVEVTASNPAPTFGLFKRQSLVTGAAQPPDGATPGYSQSNIPGITPSSTINVGDALHATEGINNPPASDGWFNPPATTSRIWSWLRCETTGIETCEPIPGSGGAEPGGRDYTLTTADANRHIRVRVRGAVGPLINELTSAPTFAVTPLPAAIAPPFVDPDTNLPVSQNPTVVGDAWVGETLVGNVGGWADPTTEFKRRWIRCEADGSACTNINQVASTDPENGPTYVVRQDDIGYTLRLRITADVNGDYSDDAMGSEGLDNHLPHEVEVDTPPSAVVTVRPPDPTPTASPDPGATPTPDPGGGGGGGVDTVAPAITGASLSKKTFAAGEGTAFKFDVSEPSSVRIVISKKTTGRKVGKACKPTSRKNRKKKKCKYQKTLTTIKRADVPAGPVSIKFSGKIGKRKLKPGKYLATIIVTDASGNSARKTLSFKIKRR